MSERPICSRRGPPMHPARLSLLLAAALLGVAAAGCFGSSSDRVGGRRPAKPVVLTLAVQAGDPALDEWVDAVARRSHGLVRISRRPDRRGREPGYEQGTLADVRAGKVDLAAVPARAFDTFGVKSFQALLAPFEVDSYALEHKVLASALPDRLLRGVKPLGVTGVALLPGPMEKLLSITSVLLRPSDFGALHLSIAVGRSRLAAATFRALGARTTDLAIRGDVFRLAAMEQGVVQAVADHHQLVTAGETLPANINLWPRLATVVMNDESYAALSPEQRGVLFAAARDALDPGLARITRDEHAVLPRICKPESFFFLTASAADRSAMRAAVSPVYGKIGGDAITATALASIDAIKQHVTPEPAPECAHRRTPRAAATRLSASGMLHRAASGSWAGRITSPRLGRGTLRLPIHDRPHTGPLANFGLTDFVARFRTGELRGCIVATISPRRRVYRWDGPGVIEHATGRLGPYAHQSLRLRGVTTRRDLRRMRGEFTTDVPSALPCDGRQGI
jgi:TRAP-type C4-dicarboxylate transport system substrate-binding protein